MKLNYFFLILLFGINIFQPVNAAGKKPSLKFRPIEMQIDSVQLYSDQALVWRNRLVQLQKGLNHFVIKDLPDKVIEDSVRVGVDDSDGIKIQKIDLKINYKKVYRSQMARKAEESLKKAESKLRALTDQYRAYKDEEKFLKKIKIAPYSKKLKNFKGRLNKSQWKTTLDFIQNSLKENYKKVKKVLPKIDEAREELTVTMAVADRYKSAKSLSKKDIYVTIESKKRRREKLGLSYRITDAGWYPIYTARVLSNRNDSDERASVRFLAYALVKNESGEDWNNIHLKFSAADPEESVELPKLTSWIIKAVQRPVRTGYRSYGKRAPNAKTAYRQKRRYRKKSKRMESKNEMDPTYLSAGGSAGQDGFDDFSLVQQSVTNQVSQSRYYYSSNKAAISERQAQKRSEVAEKSIRDLKYNLKAQSQALNRGNYKEALKRSGLVIKNINKLAPRFRGYFSDDIKKSNEIRRKSLALLETQKFISKLVLPRISSRGYDYKYSAKIPETILSDGAFHKVLIMKRDFRANLYYQVNPLSKALAFLIGKVRYHGKIPLLKGPLSVFYNTDYIGESIVGTISANEPFSLHLGSDESFKINRRESEFRVTSGILSKSFTFTKSIRIKVKNRKKKAILMEIFDRVPVSTDENVVISDIKISTDLYEKKKNGLYKFRLKLGPMEEKEISIQYQLTHPVGIIPIYNEKRYEKW